MIPSSVNKRFKDESQIMDNFLGEMKETEVCIEKEFYVDSLENDDFYSYIASEEVISENYIQKTYKNDTFFNYKALDF